MHIRPARPDDAAAVVALREIVYPYLVRGVASTRRMIAEPLPGADWVAYVAEVDARPVGWVSALRNVLTSEPDVGELNLLHVHPDHRGRGVGGALFTAAWRHLAAIGARRIHSTSPEPGLDFARSRGFAPSREIRYSACALDPAPTAPATPAGVRLAAMSELAPRQLYDADVAAAADEPGDVPVDQIGYDTTAYTCNDEANAPMLAINARLGYRPVATQFSCLATLG